MRRLFVPLLFAVCLVSPALPSGPPEQDVASRILVKLRQLDLLNQILPVLLTKEQLGKLLPVIEKAREASKATERIELDELKKLEPKVDSDLKDAKEKGLVTAKEKTTEYLRVLAALRKVREIMVNEQLETVLKAVEETLDEGQIKAATNSIQNAGDKESKVTDRDKLRRWVGAVLLDPLAYDLLLELKKKGG
ncbi:MAG: hypothetical protein JST30_05825 [Armatimonadetes bacterium]|nr:hypothetical protein [Armatimonadota bacterium]